MRQCLGFCNEAFWERLKSGIEAKVTENLGSKLSVVTLHNSHADLFYVLITWLFTLERERLFNRLKQIEQDSTVLSSENQ